MSAVTPNESKRIQEAVAAIRSRAKLAPKLGIVLGSGLGGVADLVTDRVEIPYSDIPGFRPTAVQGHAGKFIVGHLAGVPAAVLQGRFHFYEGHAANDVVFPTRVLWGLGAKTLVLTNAAGGVNTRLRAGDLMLIEDHLNLTGSSPLIGPNEPELGPRFPDLSEPYSLELQKRMHEAAVDAGIELRSGVYAGLLGPAYETPAEVRMLRALGADAVGMSTVFEAIAANHVGLKVAGVSGICNLAAGLTSQKLSHEEVLEVSELCARKLKALLQKAAPKLV